MSGRFAALVTLVLAVFVAAQVGLVRSRRDEARALRRRLGDVQARCESSELALRRELYSAQLRSEWLQAALDRRGQESRRVRSELAAAQRTLELLQLASRGAQARPAVAEGGTGALRVELVPSSDLGQLVALATNASGAPIEILEVSGRLWLGGRTHDAGFSAGGAELAAGDELELLEYNLFAGEPQRVLAGAETLRAALCFVWLPAAGAREWRDAHWFEYRPGSGEVELVRRDASPVDSGARGCDLTSASPPW